MKRISSRDNAAFKEAKRLASSSRAQRQLGECLIEGAHLIEVCAARQLAVRQLILDESVAQSGDAQRLAAALGDTPVLVLTPALFAELSQTVHSAGLLARVAIPHAKSALAAGESCVLLDGIQDPGNLGTLLRSAAAAGLRVVFLSPRCASPWSPKVLRAGQGAHFLLDLVETGDLLAVARQFQGRRVATVVHGGTPHFRCDLRGPVAFMFGSEGEGLGAELAAVADGRISIPMAEGMESLNVASAAAILMFEKLRQEAA